MTLLVARPEAETTNALPTKSDDGVVAASSAVVPKPADTVKQPTSEQPPAAETPAPKANVEPAPMKAATTPAPARKRPCRLVLGSTPAGAEVYRGQLYLCETPCNVEVEPSDKPVELRLVRSGFRAQTVTLVLEGGRRVEHNVALEQDPAARKSATKQRTRRTRAKPAQAKVPSPATKPSPDSAATKDESGKAPTLRFAPKSKEDKKKMPKLRFNQ